MFGNNYDNLANGDRKVILFITDPETETTFTKHSAIDSPRGGDFRVKKSEL